MKRIITKRPKNMSYEKYRKVRKQQTNQLRARLKHRIFVYLSSQIITEETLIGKVQRKVTYQPAIKHFDRNGKVIYKSMPKKKYDYETK